MSLDATPSGDPNTTLAVPETTGAVAVDRSIAARIFALLALFYALSTSGLIISPDGALMALVTQSLVERQSIAPVDLAYPEGFLATGMDGNRYAKYGLGLSVAAVPFYAVGRAIDRFAPVGATVALAAPPWLWYAPAVEGWSFFAMGLTNAVLVAAIAAALYLLVLELGFGRRTALLVVATASLASPLWGYSKSFFSEPLAALGLCIYLLFATRAARSAHARYSLIAGVGLAIALATKLAHVVLLPIAIACLVVLVPRPLRVRTIGLVFAAPVVALAGTALLQWRLFGNPFATGYGEEVWAWTTPFLSGVHGLLLSPGRGLVPLFPAILVVAAATPRAMRRMPGVTLFAWGCLVALVLLYSRWHGWDGGWCWGPRFLVPAIPALALLLAPLFEQPPAAGWSRLALMLVLGFSALVAAASQPVAFTTYHLAAQQFFGAGQYLDHLRWSWHLYPPLLVLRFPWDDFLVLRAISTPAAWWLAAGFGMAAGGIVVSAESLHRLLRGTGTTNQPRGLILPVSVVLGCGLAASVIAMLSS